MFYIVEHDMDVYQIIDTEGKPNKCGSWVEDDLFTKMIEGGGADGN